MAEEIFDYIVIGAGPAGSAVAARLAQSPGAPSVAVVEAGAERAPVLSNVPLGLAALVPFKGRYNYGYETTPQAGLEGRRGFQPRGRGVGGGSLINAMIYTRGQPQDYDGWAALGCTGWGWADVLPYFKRSEDNARGADALHGVGGPLHVSDLRSPSPMSEAFVQAGVACGWPHNRDFNGPSQLGVGLYQVFQKDGRRLNAGRAYLQSGPPRPNLTVIAEHPARRILFEGRRASGVVIGQPGRERTLRARREIVLSGGAFGSPQLLMVSGVGPGDELRRHGIEVVHDLPEVGRNLQDHLDYTANLLMKAKGLFGLTLPVLLGGAGSLLDLLANGRGMFTSNAAEAGGFLTSRLGLERPDLQLHFCIGLVDDHNRKRRMATGVALHVCVLRPESRGRVSLASADIADDPLIDPGFLSAPQDLELLMQGALLARAILSAPPLSGYASRPLYGTGREQGDELRALIRAHADTIYHPVGTCRMGADAASVVDPQLRVRGIEGLRVADASIMPTLISGNTQAPSAMIGEKAADLMLAG